MFMWSPARNFAYKIWCAHTLKFACSIHIMTIHNQNQEIVFSRFLIYSQKIKISKRYLFILWQWHIFPVNLKQISFVGSFTLCQSISARSNLTVYMCVWSKMLPSLLIIVSVAFAIFNQSETNTILVGFYTLSVNFRSHCVCAWCF